MMGIFVIDGAVIVVLVVLGLRERIIDAIPFDLKLAIGIGIGGFITIVGLKNAGFIVARAASSARWRRTSAPGRSSSSRSRCCSPSCSTSAGRAGPC